MRMKILSMAAALLLVAACASEEKEVATSSGSGASQQNSASPSASSGSSVSAPAPGSVEEFITIGDRVYYDFDKAEIRKDGTSTLNDQAAWLKKYPNVTIVVEGHADERGTRAATNHPARARIDVKPPLAKLLGALRRVT